MKKIKVLEILNAYPGETFIQEHATAILSGSKKTELVWAFIQTNKIGKISPPFSGGPESFALPNFNRLSKLRKGIYLIRYGGDREKARKESVKALIKRIKPDVIHFQFASTAIQLGWLPEDLNIPFTFSVRGTDVQVYPLTVAGYKDKLTNVTSQALKVHAVSVDLKTRLQTITNCNLEKIQVIRTVVNTNWSNVTRAPEPGNILTVGRLTWAKGYSDLILAAAVLKNRNVNYHLTIIGEGERRQELEYMIRDLGLENNVTLAGKKHQTEIMHYLGKAQLFVISSLYEGFPNVLGEAMMAGVPVLSTGCNGVTEILNQEEDSICAIGNPESLAMAIQKALKVIPIIRDEGLQDLARLNFNSKQHRVGFEKLWGSEHT